MVDAVAVKLMERHVLMLAQRVFIAAYVVGAARGVPAEAAHGRERGRAKMKRRRACHAACVH